MHSSLPSPRAAAGMLSYVRATGAASRPAANASSNTQPAPAATPGSQTEPAHMQWHSSVLRQGVAPEHRWPLSPSRSNRHATSGGRSAATDAGGVAKSGSADATALASTLSKLNLGIGGLGLGIGALDDENSPQGARHGRTASDGAATASTGASSRRRRRKKRPGKSGKRSGSSRSKSRRHRSGRSNQAAGAGAGAGAGADPHDLDHRDGDYARNQLNRELRNRHLRAYHEHQASRFPVTDLSAAAASAAAHGQLGGSAAPQLHEVDMVERYHNVREYLRTSNASSTAALSAVSLDVQDPHPPTFSRDDWRRYERGLYRQSDAFNEDSYDYAIVLKPQINRFSPLWIAQNLPTAHDSRDLELGATSAHKHHASDVSSQPSLRELAEGDGAPVDMRDDDDCSDETDSEGDELVTTCCLPKCGRECCGVSCVCSLPGPCSRLGSAATLGVCEWDGGRRRVEEDEARRVRCKMLMYTLRSAGLYAKRVRSLDRENLLIKVKASESRLEAEAERIKLRVRRYDGTWAKYKRSKRHLFVGPDASSHAAVFRSSDRQTLIHSILQAAYTDGGAGLGGVSPLSDSILKMFPLHMYARLMELRNDWLTFWREPMTRESSSRLDRLSEMNADQFLSGRSSMDTVMSSMQEGGDSGTVVTGSVASGEVGVDMAGGASAAQPTKGAPSAPEQPEGEGASESKRHSNASGESEATAVTHITWSTAKSRGTTTTVTSGNLAHAGDGGGASSRCGGTGSERKSAATGDACSTSTSQSKQRRRRRRKKFCGCLKRFCGSALYQPLDRIASYFGETVAFYFAWLEFYTWWLVPASVLGIILFTCQLYEGTLDHPLVPIYSLMMSLWSTLFLEFWRRRNYELAVHWGVLNYEREEVKRPQFYGKLRNNPVTGKVEKVYSPFLRNAKHVVSGFVVLAGLAGVATLMVFIFSTRDKLLNSLVVPVNATMAAVLAGNATSSEAGAAQASPTDGVGPADLDAMLNNTQKKEFWLALALPSALYGFMIPIIDWVFHKIARFFNKWENHETESRFRSSLVWKVFPFRAFNSFVSLYYYAFSAQHSILMLSVQLASFVVGSQLWNNIVQVVLPCVCRKRRHKKVSKRLKRATLDLSSGHGRSRLRQAKSKAWEESRLDEYDTFEDYAEMMIQFGYVTCFSMSFPLAPLFALVNNFFEIRADAYKLCYNTQRPVARKAGGIGVWFRVLWVMSIMSLMTNCVHIAITSRVVGEYFPFLRENRLVLIFVLEHIILGVCMLIAYMIPHVPEKVKRKMETDNYRLSLVSLHSESAPRL